MIERFNQIRFNIQQQSQESGQLTFVHALHPLVKIWLTAILVILVVSVGKYDLKRLIPFLFYPFIMLAIADIPLSMVWKFVLPALPFALFAGVANLFLEKQTAFAFGKLSVPFGLLSFLVILLKTFLTVSSVVLLFATTAQKSLIAALSAIKVPGLLLVQLSMSLRYLSILTDETQRMSAAYLLRSGTNKGIHITNAGGFLGHLLLRSYQRAERISAAMTCRGFKSDSIFHDHRLPAFCKSDFMMTVAGTGGLILLRFVVLPY